jgi:hypothetical protein
MPSSPEKKPFWGKIEKTKWTGAALITLGVLIENATVALMAVAGGLGLIAWPKKSKA